MTTYTLLRLKTNTQWSCRDGVIRAYFMNMTYRPTDTDEDDLQMISVKDYSYDLPAYFYRLDKDIQKQVFGSIIQKITYATTKYKN